MIYRTLVAASGVLMAIAIPIGNSRSMAQAPSSGPANSTATAPAPSVASLEPVEVFRGTLVTVRGENFPKNSEEIAVQLNSIKLTASVLVESEKQFKFAVPADLLPGRYVVRVVFGVPPQPTVGPLLVPISTQQHFLRVLNDSPTKLKLTAVHPLVSYPSDRQFALRLLGEGFGEFPDDNVILADGRQMPVEWLGASQVAGNEPGKVYGRIMSSREIDLTHVPGDHYYGRMRFQVRFGEAVSEPVDATLAGVPRIVPLLAALVVVAALAAGLYWMVVCHLNRHRIDGTVYGPVASLLLDKESDTYSLSKLQLFLWTTAAVFGYVYLTIARCLVQWHIELAEIPENLPGLLLVSAGTTAGAVGITSMRGPKGAGEISASPADLITSGGVVVAERFQFLVWTILGVASLLFVIMISDPGSLVTLPKIPEGFLYLMGVSSAGYLGGKLLRKPGPIIDSTFVQDGSCLLTIRGRNLSQNASFRIDDIDLSVEQKQPEGAASANAQTTRAGDAELEVVRRDEPTGQPDFATELRLTIRESWWKARGVSVKTWRSWFGASGARKLCVINPDGQKAVWPVEVKPATA